MIVNGELVDLKRKVMAYFRELFWYSSGSQISPTYNSKARRINLLGKNIIGSNRLEDIGRRYKDNIKM
jgi:hypothetical protein